MDEGKAVTGDDLKRMQDHFLEGAKHSLRQTGRLRPIGFVVTLHEHVEELLESGWALEILDPRKAFVRDQADGRVATLIVDLLMDWRRLYQATLTVFPQTRGVLPQIIARAQQLGTDDPYKRTMQPFMVQAQLSEKDVIAATMRHICDKVDAFASIFQSEAWLRAVEPETDGAHEEQAQGSLGDDPKSVEVIVSSMETYDFARMVTLPIQRRAAARSKRRDHGKVTGFGEPTVGLATPGDSNVLEGHMVRFLKPLKDAS